MDSRWSQVITEQRAWLGLQLKIDLPPLALPARLTRLDVTNLHTAPIAIEKEHLSRVLTLRIGATISRFVNSNLDYFCERRRVVIDVAAHLHLVELLLVTFFTWIAGIAGDAHRDDLGGQRC